jgi:hypothetical protein
MSNVSIEGMRNSNYARPHTTIVWLECFDEAGKAYRLPYFRHGNEVYPISMKTAGVYTCDQDHLTWREHISYRRVRKERGEIVQVVL